MLNLKNYELLRKVSKEEWNKLYNFAIKRSKEIVNGIDKEEEMIQVEAVQKKTINKPKKRYRSYGYKKHRIYKGKQ